MITIALLSPALSQTSAATSTVNNQCDVEIIIGTPGLYHPLTPPVGRIRILSARYGDLEDTLIGYEKTHVPLVKYNGRAYGPAGATDDLGAYYFIPQVAARFGLSLRFSIDVFYLTLLVAAAAAGGVGCCLALRTCIGKIWALAELAILAALIYSSGDVYILLACTVMAIVPLALYISAVPRVATAALFVFASGVAISIANVIRSHSGTGVLAFLVCLVLGRFAGGTYRKLVLVLLLLCGVALPNIYFTHLLRQRDRFLKARCPNYPDMSDRHIFWHAAYLGFGYLTNDVVVRYDDQIAYDKVQSIAPGTLYGSATYETILRQQVLSLVRRHPKLVFYTLAAKLGVICSLIMLSANIGLIAARLSRMPIGLELAFWVGIGFDALFGILVIPVATYLLGLITFATLFGAVSVDFALQRKVYKSSST
jgi:hypothetical protein